MPSGTTRASVKAGVNEAPHHGFDRALNVALNQLSKDVGTGSYTVKIEFEAEVDVSNPGTIGMFTVIVSA